MIKIVEGLTFDDVLLIPRFSNVKSRKDIDLSIELTKGLSFKHPIIPANMKTVTGIEMAKEIYKSKGMAILHRFMPWNEQNDVLATVLNMEKQEPWREAGVKHIGLSVGVKEDDYKKVDYFADKGVLILCIDIAHGDSEQCVKMTEYISKKYPNVFLIAGNVATAGGAKILWKAGADCVKVGIGPGSLCTTRIETGNGIPQLTALENIASMKKTLTSPWEITRYKNNYGRKEIQPPIINRPIFIIADGGIKAAGDIVKSLCFADMVMVGNLFAGTDETPGEISQVGDKRFKSYVGSSTHKTNNVEGVMALVPTKGPASNVLNRLAEGLRSGLSYQGCVNLTSLKEDPQFVRITNAGLKESHAHDVIVV